MTVAFAGYKLKETTEQLERTVSAAGSLIALVQAALDISGYVPVASADYYGWAFEHPGLAFGHLLSCWRGYNETDDDIAVVDRLIRPHVNRGYTEFLSIYLDRLESQWKRRRQARRVRRARAGQSPATSGAPRRTLIPSTHEPGPAPSASHCR